MSKVLYTIISDFMGLSKAYALYKVDINGQTSPKIDWLSESPGCRLVRPAPSFLCPGAEH